MASSSSSYMHAAVAFSKVPGTLSLHSNEVVRWTPSSTSAGVAGFDVRFTDIAGLQTSKAGAAQIALMLVLANGVQIAGKPKVLLVFNAAQDVALDDREKFKTELAAAVGRNRAAIDSGTPAPASPGPTAAAAPIASPSSPAVRAATPDTRPTTPTPGASKTTSGPLSSALASRTASPSIAASVNSIKRAAATERPSKTDIELRISVIKSNPQLRALHKDIVASGQMSDAEFWSHPQRQRLIRAERTRLEQRAGRNARLADPKPTPNEAGELKLSITPELIRDLFEQFPVVARAYEENVPSKLDEGAFWTRYFQSKLYHRLRTSARSAASEHIVQDDDVFDRYLEEEDNQLEPRKTYNPHDRLLDLQATEEDHGETGNGKDWTMRAGAERRTLPLMRRFNDHSQSLLDSALGDQQDQDRRKRRRIVGGVGEEYPSASGGGGGGGPTLPVSVVDGRSGNPPLTGATRDATDDNDNDNNQDEADDAVDWIKNHYYREIVIDDLQEKQKSDKVRLNMANLESYLNPGSHSQDHASASSSSGASSARTGGLPADPMPQTMTDYVKLVQGFTRGVLGTRIELGSFDVSKTAAEKSMAGMLANLSTRTKVSGSASFKSLPEGLQKGLVTLQASTTEFLRQFWNSIAPAPASALEEADSSRDVGSGDNSQHPGKERLFIQQRRTTAVKMATNLAKTRSKVDALLETHATHLDQDMEESVEILLSPTMQAVEKALGIAKASQIFASS
ncbi:hypothetical protein BCV70DRAFT_200854 [Testicularia cyperi]|uniref:BSD domain-containing protein n=1 Tax=Testicularia cyperi TaxID=1882483 RepID=A0A317XLU4_9BASI|nr:hypothetical protein BCV70DRAFT_200854 [Testicularia cyperi]